MAITVPPIVLPAAIYKQIEAEGMAAFPNECCGIMYGRDEAKFGPLKRVVERLEPVTNDFEAGERHHRFLIAPEVLVRAEKAAAAEGLLVVGFYHSHPDHPAKPSEYDRDHGWPFYSYVIVSIMSKESKFMTSWVLNERTNEFNEQTIELLEPRQS